MSRSLEAEIFAAKSICRFAHEGQFRRDGRTPYHTHPFAVADAVPDEFKPAAYLHDVCEDTPISAHDLKVLHHFSDRTVAAVVSLTRRKTETYNAYMARVLENPDAVRIKIADMEHNLSCDPSENSKAKIAFWLPVLKGAVLPTAATEGGAR